MTDLNNIKRVYFLGIGGIGMSALARYFKAQGKPVAGYDRTPTTLTGKLQEEGMAIHFKDSPEQIPESFRSPEGTLVVFTSAIPPGLQELLFFKEHKHIVHKRSEILGMLALQKKTIAVAGTHGKTTVSSMLAYLLSLTDSGCNAFLGGISKNINSNLIYKPDSSWMVAEADEFDRSFLQLHPYAAILTAIDPDHLDVYGNIQELHQAFDRFVSQIQKNGVLLMKQNLPLNLNSVRCRTFTYSLDSKADFFVRNIRLQNNKYSFDFVGPDVDLKDISLTQPGLVNVENAVAAISMAVVLGVDSNIIRSAMASFTGIQRRFDIQIMKEDFIYIDDYGHHPKEIEATIASVRALYPGKRITGIFQPHLYTRTRDLVDGFAQSLGMLDDLILLDIYPARELPIPGISSEIILNKVPLANKMLCSGKQLLDELISRKIEVLLTMGAGDIDRYVEPIKQLYS